MKSLVPTYTAPRPGADVTGDVILDIPEPSSVSQSLWCSGLGVARLDMHAHGFVTLHVHGEEPFQIYVCVRGLPDVERQLLSFTSSSRH